jgi:hypothetical protein
MVREATFDAWEQLTVATFFVTLILTLATGDQITRDRDRRVTDVLLSTQMATKAYVWGKYLAILTVSLGVATLMLPGALLMDHIGWRNPPVVLGHSLYPSLGPWPYLSAWLWLTVVPVIFGVALSLACITLTHGQRVISSLVAIVLWFGPALFASSYSGGPLSLLDIAGWSLYGSVIDALSASLPPSLHEVFLSGATPTPAIAAQMVQFMTAHLPPVLPGIFVWNRIFFVALAGLLLLLTALYMRAQRRGAR